MPHYRSSCTSILIGKKATIDQSVIIGRNEDAKTAWPKHLQFNKRTDRGPSTFKSKDNKFTMSLPSTAFAYSATPEWTDKYGIFAEDGINEYNVAMSATESAYANERVLACDPFNEKSGILEEAMVSVVLPYVKTAREGVERLGQIVAEHGAAEADGILFADEDEAWYMELGSGHHYVAIRIPDDSYAVVANQLSIQEIDFSDPQNFIWSDGIQDFVYDNQLWPKDQPFFFREIFGTRDDSDLTYNTPRVWDGQRLLTPSLQQEPQSFDLAFLQKPDRPLSAQDAQKVLSSHFNNTQYDLTNAKNEGHHAFRPIAVATTQESHVLQVKKAPFSIHWLAMGVSAQSVYVPFYPGADKVPTAYRYGKETYAANSAYWVFKQAGVLVDRDWQTYGALLGQTQQKCRIELNKLRHSYDEKLKDQAADRLALYNEANEKMAQLVLTEYRTLIAKLITKQTGDSLLRFKMDPNL